jgi:hypothetical protein
MPEPGNVLGKVQGAGLQALPALEAGFYYDLAVKAVTAVLAMKAAKQWPDPLPLSKCSSQLGAAASPPTVRALDLLANFKVTYSHFMLCSVTLSSARIGIIGKRLQHRLNMVLDLQSSVGLLCTAVLIG